MWFLFIAKIIGGSLLGLVIAAFAEMSSGLEMAFMILWGLGIVFAFRSHLRMMANLMRSAMQLSIIAFLSFGSGFLGFLLLLVVFLFNLIIGWVYGIYLMIRELIGLLRR